MSDPRNEQDNPAGQDSFRTHVERLVDDGKLTPEEAATLLEGTDEPSSPSATIAQYVQAVQSGEAVGLNLKLEIEGYMLNVVQDSSVSAPTLNASQEGLLEMTASENGLTVKRARHTQGLWPALKAILTLPFQPQHVKVEINGGSLSIGDIAGEMRAEVNGGNINMGRAAGLNAEVNGGNLNAGDIHGHTKTEVNGGNLTITDASSLDAEVNGGNLRWTGTLHGGTHRTEVNAGNASITLKEGSSVRLDAEVTLGNFKADFPTHKRGGFMEAHYTGQLGGGEALLRCEVSAGQLKVMTQ